MNIGRFYHLQILGPSLLLILTFCSPKETSVPDQMMQIPGGTFTMGAKSNEAYRDEFPKHTVQVDGFYMDKTEVTNAQFLEFVTATGYVTQAEMPLNWEELKAALPDNTPKPPDSLLLPSSLVFYQPKSVANLTDYSQWWKVVNGADWKHPDGPGSSIEKRMAHPVVHITYEDAIAYATWAGKRLPTEAEWEWASMGGLENAIYPWGNESIETSVDKANFWQGIFPVRNSTTDGFEKTAPVASFPPNGYGLYDMAGNVWEICQDKYNISSYQEYAEGIANNPKGSNTSYDPYDPMGGEKRTIRGGSFLCNDSYCSGYRTSRRMAYAQLSSANHVGFRCVKDL